MVRLAVSEDFDFIYTLYFHPDINPYLLYEMKAFYVSNSVLQR